jgi:hypothetical protein
VLSSEHKQVGEFTEAEVPGLTMPSGYKNSIATWFAALRDFEGAGIRCARRAAKLLP